MSNFAPQRTGPTFLSRPNLTTSLAIAATIGEVFLILSALQILPQGVNAISQLGTRTVISIALAIPALVIVIATVIAKPDVSKQPANTGEARDTGKAYVISVTL